jgi:hypothetical protein
MEGKEPGLYRSTTSPGGPSPFFLIWQVKYTKLLEMASFGKLLHQLAKTQHFGK